MKGLRCFWECSRIIAIIFVVALILSQAGCGSSGASESSFWGGNGDGGGAGTPQIQSEANLNSPSQPIRAGDWLQINGQGFGNEQGTSYVEFTSATGVIANSDLYSLWANTEIICRVPISILGRVVQPRDAWTFRVFVNGQWSNSAVLNGNPNPNPTPAPTPPSPSPSPTPSPTTSPSPSPTPSLSPSPSPTPSPSPSPGGGGITPKHLVFGQQPSDIGPGLAISPAVTVEIRNASNQLVTAATNQVTLTIATNPDNAALSGTISVPAVGGVATFSNLSLNKVGTGGYTLNATASGFTPVTSAPFFVRPWPIDIPAISADSQRIVVDRFGNVTAVWIQVIFTGASYEYRIYTRHYDITSGTWGNDAEQIDSDIGNASQPQVCVDRFGNVTAIWSQNDGTYDSIYARRYDITLHKWVGTAERIDNDPAATRNSYSPHIAVDSAGNVTAVWLQMAAGPSYDICARRYDFASGWVGTAEQIDNYPGVLGNVGHVNIASDPSGNVTAIWSQYDGISFGMYARRCSSGTWAGSSEKIDTYQTETGNSYSPQIAADSAGNVTAVWQLYEGGVISRIYARRYDITSGKWVGDYAEQIDNNPLVTGYANPPQIVVDSATGVVTAIWDQSDNNYYRILARRCSSGAWVGTAEEIDSSSVSEDALNPQVAVDSTTGNVTAVWQQIQDGVGRAFARNCSSGTWVGTPYEIDNYPGVTEYVYYPQVAVDPFGTVTAIWQQTGTGYSRLYETRY
jgi:hypothetical protein